MTLFDSLTLSTLPPEDEALRPAIRALINSAIAGLAVDRRARSWQGFDSAFSRALGAAGYLGLTLPKCYGGGGHGAFARFVVVEELLTAGAPVAAHWIADRQSAPLILNYGTEAQRQAYLPRICRGEVFLCIGMSEPGSGSDLASVRTRAERTAHGWRVNGKKIWTSNSMHSDYMIALVRTSGSAAAVQIANIAHAVHGAIGISAEYDLQLFTRRLHLWRLADGSESWWARVLGEIRFDDGASSVDFVRG